MSNLHPMSQRGLMVKRTALNEAVKDMKETAEKVIGNVVELPAMSLSMPIYAIVCDRCGVLSCYPVDTAAAEKRCSIHAIVCGSIVRFNKYTVEEQIGFSIPPSPRTYAITEQEEGVLPECAGQGPGTLGEVPATGGVEGDASVSTPDEAGS